MSFDAISYAMGRKAGGGSGGGGNPNRVEVISGALGNPYGDVDVVALAQELQIGDADVTLAFSAESKSWMLTGEVDDVDEDSDYALIMFRYADFETKQQSERARFNAACVGYETEEGETTFYEEPFVRVNSSSTATTYDVDEDTACTLTIRWHPMPEGS